MQVAFFPSGFCENPYMTLLEAALKCQGITVAEGVPRAPYRHWLKANRGRIDVLHIHWPEAIYNDGGTRAAHRSGLLLPLQLLVARMLGYRVVWTMHNLHPHQRRYPVLDIAVWHGLAIVAQAIVVHCEDTRHVLNRRFWRYRDIYTVPIGNYIGVHGPPVDRALARRGLGLPQGKRVLLFLGAVKPYKGIEHLLLAFSRLPSDDLVLLVAGKPETAEYGREILALAGADPRIHCELRWIEDDELALYMGACDAVVLPYVQIQSSSSAVLAMSYGRPFIAPAVGCLSELIDAGVGILYDPEDPAALVAALDHSGSADLAQMGARGLARAASWQWSSVGAVTRAAYEGTNSSVIE